MPAPLGTPVPDAIQARARDLLAQGDQIGAIKLIREHAPLSIAEAGNLITTLAAGQPPASPGAPGQPGSPPDEAPDLTAALATALHHAKRMAGNPSYDRLSNITYLSVPTISRAFAGRTLPRWRTVESILKALGVSGTQVDAQWRNRWAQALDQRNPVREHPADPGTQRPEHSATQQRRQEPSQARECEDCGALIGNLTQHQAWHWRIERQLRRTAMRAIDGTSQ